MDENKKEELQKELKELEAHLYESDFWADKNHAKDILEKIKEVKERLEDNNDFNKGGIIINILSGAGGDDSEDFSKMLFNMYLKYFEKNNWKVFLLHKNQNDNGGYRNISAEVIGKNIYGKLKNENGVHRLVRISPFNANSKRHTSFSMVEILPILPKLEYSKFKNTINEADLNIETTKSGGPGGQNVNKRETAVRITHLPSKISVIISTERSQIDNKEKAFELLYSKLYKLEEENREKQLNGLQISKTAEIEWGNQIRNYILHPYKLIKDLRTNKETTDINSVLNKGELDIFIEK